MDGYDFEKLAREILSSRIGELEQKPELAADIAREMIVPAVKSTRQRQDPRATVAAVARGILGGLMLLGKSLPEGAVGLLKAMGAVAADAHLDPQDVMIWSMEGIAAVCRTAGPQTADRVEAAIEENFMGAGGVFHELLSRAAKPAGA